MLVHYNPSNPKQAVLEPGVRDPFSMVAAGILGAVIAGLGAFMVLVPVSGPSKSHHVARRGPYDVVGLILVLVTGGVLAYWMHRRKDRFNPIVPTAVIPPS